METAGRRSPRGPLLDNVRLGMLFFLSAETMLFAAFVSGFFVLRLAAPQWPPPLQPRLPVIVTGINTFILMTSSAALIVAMAAFRRRDRTRLSAGARPHRSARHAVPGRAGLRVGPADPLRPARHVGRVRGDVLHADRAARRPRARRPGVAAGVALRLASRGRFLDGRAGVLRACAIYWHFVVGLWPILYVAVYLT